MHSKSKYKSNNINYVRDSYLNTYRRFLELLEFNGIEEYEHWEDFQNPELNPPGFLKYWTLHFPESKLILIFPKNELEELVSFKKGTSLKGFIELSKINDILFKLLKMLQKATHESMNAKAIKIVQDFLKHEESSY